MVLMDGINKVAAHWLPEPGAYLCCKWVPYFCEKNVDCLSKTMDDKTYSNFTVKHTNASVFQHPTVGVKSLTPY